METVQFKAMLREKNSGSYNNELRNQGFVPAVLYGREIGTFNVYVSEKDLSKIIAKSGENVFAKMTLQQEDAETEYNVLFKEVQRHPVKGTLLHIDFNQVSMSEKLNTVVPVVLVGDSPGVEEGGILQQMLREIDIRCLPGNIPSSVEVDISGLGIGDNVMVESISVPEEVEIITELTEVIAAVAVPQEEEEEETTEEMDTLEMTEEEPDEEPSEE